MVAVAVKCRAHENLVSNRHAHHGVFVLFCHPLFYINLRIPDLSSSPFSFTLLSWPQVYLTRGSGGRHSNICPSGLCTLGGGPLAFRKKPWVFPSCSWLKPQVADCPHGVVCPMPKAEMSPLRIWCLKSFMIVEDDLFVLALKLLKRCWGLGLVLVSCGPQPPPPQGATS